MMSSETAKAIQSIRRILTTLDVNHGVLDVLSLYPTKDVIMSVVCLSRLQHAASKYVSLLEKKPSSFDYDAFTNSAYDLFSLVWKQENLNQKGDDANERRNEKAISIVNRKLPSHRNVMNSNITNNDIEHERELLYELAHYAVFASAAYGWAMGLLSGKLYRNNLVTLLSKTGVKVSTYSQLLISTCTKYILKSFLLARECDYNKLEIKDASSGKNEKYLLLVLCVKIIAL